MDSYSIFGKKIMNNVDDCLKVIEENIFDIKLENNDISNEDEFYV